MRQVVDRDEANHGGLFPPAPATRLPGSKATAMIGPSHSLRTMPLGDWQAIRQVLDHGRGYVILEDFPVDGRSVEEISRDFEALVSRLGIVTPHGASGQTIWRISPRAELGHVPTFSEAAGEAPLHTDNSWVEAPEQYFALLVIQPARDGGESLLFPVAELLREFRQMPEGPAVIRTLSERLFPFAMPAVFRSDAERAARATPVVTAPVLRAHALLRYRHDIIQAGFQVRPDLATQESVAAVDLFDNFLTDLLRRSPGVKLQRGNVLLANNHTVLHARTHFSDPDRLLLRARMALPPILN